ncbi:MAG: hypothetical protein QXH41_04470 [Metallosphaera sp.]
MSQRPSMKIDIIEVEAPCNSECLEGTEFRSLLSDETFRSRLEVIDSLVSLIKEQVSVLRREVKERITGQGVNIDSLTYAIYRLVEYGGNTSLGEKVTFDNRVIAEGPFNFLVNVNGQIDRIIKDPDIRSICDEIRYLIEALWEHFNKNMVRD